jgi:hypothetical protein
MRRQPFAPFDIRTSEGRVYTVDHPEFIKLYRHDEAVNYTTEDDRDIIIDAHHIVALEVTNSRAAGG